MGTIFINPFVHGGDGGGDPGGGDEHFANVVLLVHFDGADGATSATDESNSAHSLTFNGNAQIDTAQSKFGGASLLLDGTGDFVNTPDSDDWYLGTDPFTIEFWLRFNSIAGDQCFISHVVLDPATHGWFIDRVSGGLRFVTHEAVGTNFSLLQAPWNPIAGTWYHICAERTAAGLHTLFVNGAVHVQNTLTIRDVANVADGVRIGSLNLAGTERYTNGWIDDVRITKGVARYGGVTFTPPTEAFPDS